METKIELLEKELNSLGANWNLFGKVDKMKYLLKEIKKEIKSDFNFEAEIQKLAFTVESNHGIIELKVPYGYSKIEKIDKSKRIVVSIKYE
jgi:GTP-sensing pleiotropic transcriptional regulator CodY